MSERVFWEGGFFFFGKRGLDGLIWECVWLTRKDLLDDDSCFGSRGDYCYPKVSD